MPHDADSNSVPTDCAQADVAWIDFNDKIGHFGQ